jgi:hypothetical protein
MTAQVCTCPPDVVNDPHVRLATDHVLRSLGWPAMAAAEAAAEWVATPPPERPELPDVIDRWLDPRLNP